MRKNILIFCHGYATQFIDINNLYTQLFDKNKYEVTVAYLVGEPNDTVKQRHLADHIIFMDVSKRESRGLKINTIKKMMRLQRDKQFQIVICHRYKPTYIMLWVSRFYKIPALFSVMHELKTMHAFFRKLSVLLLAQKNIFFAGVSNAVRDDLRNALWRIPKERIITFYNVIDIDSTQPLLLDPVKARLTLDLSPNDFVFGTIGRLAKAKDQKTLLLAFAAIKPSCPNAKLIIIGDGELELELKEHIKQLHLTEDVIMTGFLDKAVKYLKAFDVFVLPSIKEAFGYVLLEAMTAKVPIIAAKTNGIPEVVAETGILFPAKNSEALSHEMLTLYQQSKEQQFERGELGYQRVTNTFSLQHFHQLFWQLPIFTHKEHA
jgi:glycosyltransferase involved in cell wall biosynthesis